MILLEQKGKKKKLSIRRFIMLLLILFLIGYSFYYVLNQNIENIFITGNKLVTDTEIMRLANIEDYPPIFKQKSSKMIKNIKKHPLINDVQINKSISGKLTITVDENKVLFINKLNNTYVLSNGEEIPFDNSYLGVPVLLNYVESDIYRKFVSESAKIRTEIYDLISEIEYSPSKNEEGNIIDEDVFLLRMNDKNIVYITSYNLSALNHYTKMYDTLDGNGVIYCDLTSSTKCYVKNHPIEEVVEETEEEKKDDSNAQ